MTTWFTSDLHFGHRMVAATRGFETADEHDGQLVENWVQHVRPEDTVWVLGDVAVSSPLRALEILFVLPGTKHLIAGNHDKCHPMHRDAHNWQRRYMEVFASVQPFARRKILGHPVLLSHFPYHVDREEPRHTQYRLRDEGLLLLHGHLHTRERRTSVSEIHVGVDAWELAPVSLETIQQML